MYLSLPLVKYTSLWPRAGTILWKYNKNTYIIRTPFSRRHHRRNSKNLFFIYSQSVDKHNTQQSYVYTHCCYMGGGGNRGSVGLDEVAAGGWAMNIHICFSLLLLLHSRFVCSGPLVFCCIRFSLLPLSFTVEVLLLLLLLFVYTNP